MGLKPVHRGQNGGESRLHLGPHAGMGENVEFVFPDGSRARARRRQRDRAPPRSALRSRPPWPPPDWPDRAAATGRSARAGCARSRRCAVRTKLGHSTLTPMPCGLSCSGKALRHADHGKFARPVGAESQSGLHPRHRCGVDDMAAFAMGADMRQEALDAVEHAHQVDVDHPSPIIQRDVVDAAAGSDTGIVAHHMHMPERVECGLRRALDACGVGDIADGAANVRGDFLQAFDRGLQRIRLDIGQHHFHAGLGKRPAERKSDACGSAGHKGRLAGEFSHGRSSRDLSFPTCMMPRLPLANSHDPSPHCCLRSRRHAGRHRARPDRRAQFRARP